MTYDESVRELGPPDKKETTSDGILVAEWLIQPSRVYASPTPMWGRFGWHPMGPLGWGMFGPEVSSTPHRFLRLQFDVEGRLLEWKQFYR